MPLLNINDMKRNVKKIVHWAPRVLILIVAIFFFVFALLSGAEQYDGGLKGILMNSPNALPWLVLFIIVWIAWKWEKIGGWLFILIAVIFTFFFDVYETPVLIFILIIPLWVVGILFLISNKLNKKR